MRYRTGTKLGRTIYRIEDEEAWGDGTFIGIMDTAEDAAMVVEALSFLEEAKKLMKSHAPENCSNPRHECCYWCGRVPR